MTLRSLKDVILAAAACLAAGGAQADDDDEFRGTWSLQIENDRIAQTDRHYTNGLRISWVSDKKEKTEGPDWARNFLNHLYPWADVTSGRIGFAVGHNMYTPEDTDTTALVEDDRPYAGWLYGSVSLHVENENAFGIGGLDVLDSVELKLDFGPPQIRPTLSGPPTVEDHDGLGWHLFAGAEGRAVLRNIFLDGNTFADSHEVDKKTFIGNFQLGLSLAWRNYRLAFTHVFLSKEFETQRRSDRYGALTLSARF